MGMACLHACMLCRLHCPRVLTASVGLVAPCLLIGLQKAPMGCAAAPAWQPQRRRRRAAKLAHVRLMLLMERRKRRSCR